LTGGLVLSMKEKFNLRSNLFGGSSNGGIADFNLAEAIENISLNRERIPDRYWDDTTLNISEEKVRLERQSNMTTQFTMEGRKGDICKLKVTTDNYSDTHECNGKEFGHYVSQIRLDNFEVKKLKELYILSKEHVTLADLVHCENMEIRRDAIKKMGYDEIKESATILDTFKDYDLLDLRFGGEDFGRFLKMVDSTSKAVYLLQVPRTRDFGTVKIQMNKAEDALAWSFDKQKSSYHPEIET